MIARNFVLGVASTAVGLTPAGWLMMIGSVGMVLILVGFCVYRALREPHPEQHMHAPLDIDTRDKDND